MQTHGFTRAPLLGASLRTLRPGAIQPAGWLREQLERLQEGIGGRLDALLPSVSATLTGASWDAAAFLWLEGQAMLSHMLGDRAGIERVSAYAARLLASQRDDGSFGPEGAPDGWAHMAACRALRRIYEATGDRAIPIYLLKYGHHLSNVLSQTPLSGDDRMRGGEWLDLALWLYDMTGKPYLLKLAQRVRDQLFDWTSYFHSFPDAQPLSRRMSREQLEAGCQGGESEWYERLSRSTLGVNLSMALSTPALLHRLDGGLKQRQAHDIALERLQRHHGVAGGMWTCDRHLAGDDPTQGVDAYAIAEAVRSLGALIALTGDASLADRLERIAYNALPASLDGASLGVQPMQQADAIAAKVGDYPWFDASADDRYALGDPETAAAVSVAVPLFAASQWMQGPNGIVATSYAPCTVRATLGGEAVRLRVDSRYPYDGDVRVSMRMRKAATFEVALRIPAWAEGATVRVNGEAVEGEIECGGYCRIARTWRAGDEIALNLPMEARRTRWFHQTIAVERGPVVFAYAGEGRSARGAAASIVDGAARRLAGARSMRSPGADAATGGAASGANAANDGGAASGADAANGGSAASGSDAASIPTISPAPHAVSDDPTAAAALPPPRDVAFPGAWNYALLEGALDVRCEADAHAPKSAQRPPVVIRASAARCAWKARGDAPASPPVCPVVAADAAETIELVPYGWTDVRIAQFPSGLVKP